MLLYSSKIATADSILFCNENTIVGLLTDFYRPSGGIGRHATLRGRWPAGLCEFESHLRGGTSKKSRTLKFRAFRIFLFIPNRMASTHAPTVFLWYCNKHIRFMKKSHTSAPRTKCESGICKSFCKAEDAELSPKGGKKPVMPSELIAASGLKPRIVSLYLRRAIQTLDIALDAMDRMWLPVVKDWHLNERHYGALQGLNKAATAEKYGDEQVPIGGAAMMSLRLHFRPTMNVFPESRSAMLCLQRILSR